MDILRIFRVFLRFCWLAIHPIRKSEEVVGMLGFIVTFLIFLGLIGAGVAGLFAPSPLPEPSPRWSLIVAYPTILLAILFLVAGLRLQYRLSVIDELTNIKPGDVLNGKDINVSLMFQQLKSDNLAVVTFEHCVLRGPCTVILRGNYKINACDFGSNLPSKLIKGETGSRYFGVGVFVHCTFNFCKFDNLSFLVSEEERKKLLEKVTQV